jgi:pyruvate kinase
VLAAGSSRRLYAYVFNRLIREHAVAPGDKILLTRGEFEGIAGGTNTMQVLTVPETMNALDGDD